MEWMRKNLFCNAGRSSQGIEDNYSVDPRPQLSIRQPLQRCQPTSILRPFGTTRPVIQPQKPFSSPQMKRYGTVTSYGATTTATMVSPPTVPSRSSKPQQLKAIDGPPKKEQGSKPVIAEVTGALMSLLNNPKLKHAHCAIFHFSSNNNFKCEAFEKSWKWDNPNYVRIPLSSQNRTYGGLLKWDVILEELIKLKSLCETGSEIGHALGKSIKIYNDSSRETNFWVLENPDISHRLRKTLPIIVEYAIQLENLLGEPIPYLKQGKQKTIYVTRRLACSLLAHCFLCTVPHEGRHYDMPHFHCLNLFHMDHDAPTRMETKLEKIKCILEYFNQMENLSSEEGNRIISYERRCIPQRYDWARSESRLCDFYCDSQTGIETAKDMLQVDFANKRVGGGILSEGMVMEEIRFAICPELILSRLFTEPLQDDEVLMVTGTKQFSIYSGYGTSFRFEKGVDPSPTDKDSLGREHPQVVAMDALPFNRYQELSQYQKSNIDRELHKCYVGFAHGKHISPIATGNWGCGVFNGDKQLKIILQWMAASVRGRPRIAFYTGSVEQSQSIEKFGAVLKIRNISVGKVYRTLLKYQDQDRYHSSGSYLSVFEFVHKNLDSFSLSSL